MEQAIDMSALEEGPQPEESRAEVSEEFEFDEEQLLTDLDEAITLIKRAKTLIDYLADPELCKTVSKKERNGMFKLSGKLGEYVNSIESNYGEVGIAVDNDLFI